VGGYAFIDDVRPPRALGSVLKRFDLERKGLDICIDAFIQQ